MAGGEDITLRIGGDAEGAKRAAAEAKGAVEGLGQAAGQAAGPVGAAGAAGEEAGKGFDFGRREAARLAQTLLYTTGIGGQFAGSLTYLLQAALNPATLGFAAAIIAVQGLTYAFRAAAAETETEKRRMEELVRTYAEAAGQLEELQRLRGDLTGAGTAVAREQQFVAMRAAIPEAEATELLKAMVRTHPDATEAEIEQMAFAFKGRTGKETALGPAEFARKYRRGRAPETVSKLEAAGRQFVQSEPTQRAAAMTTAAVEMEERAGLGEAIRSADEAAMRRILTAELGPDIVAGYDRAMSIAKAQRGGGWGAWGVSAEMLKPEEVRRYRAGEAEVRSQFGVPTIHVTHIGMAVNQDLRGPGGRNIHADGQPRGPGD